MEKQLGMRHEAEDNRKKAPPEADQPRAKEGKRMKNKKGKAWLVIAGIARFENSQNVEMMGDYLLL